MSSLNKVQIMGRLGADPEVRRTGNGDPIVNMRVATSETWRDKNSGDRKERTEWHTVVIFNENLCKVAEQYLKKGSLVFLEGMLATRKWQDKDGQDRYSTEIVLKQFRGELILMPNGEKRTGANSPDDYGQESTRDSGRSSREPEGSRYGSGGGGGGRHDLDDDIPF